MGDFKGREAHGGQDDSSGPDAREAGPPGPGSEASGPMERPGGLSPDTLLPAPNGSEEASAFALRSARMGDWDYNLVTGEARRSAIHDRCFGFSSPPPSWTMEDFLERVHPDDRLRLKSEIQAAVTEGPGGGMDSQFRVIWPDGSAHWLWSRGWAHAGASGVERISGVTMEVTEARERGDRLAYLANHDALTGLPNRALFHDRLEQAVRNARRRKGRIGAIYLDVDRFKWVNDTLGHAVGDELLRQIGQRLESCKREEDTVSRLGGDEFAILCPDAGSKSDIEALLGRVYAAMSRPVSFEGREVMCSLSCGAAVYPDDARGQEDLLKRADAALYAAKRAGRARYEFYQESMGDCERDGAGLEADLRQAVERGEIFLEYQPVVEIDTGRLVAAEALARWSHPELGLIRPDRLIPLAEQTGMILRLGDWAVSEAARDLARWRRGGAGEVTVSVNISHFQLRQDGFSQNLAAALRREGAPPELFRVELCEGALELQSAREAAQELAGVGVGVCVDDFGGGCSCLARLSEIPARSFKLSAELTSRVETDAKSAAIARALAGLAVDIGAQCVAKGVESAAQQTRLKALGARYAQGNHIAGPMSAQAFFEWAIERHRRLGRPGDPRQAANEYEAEPRSAALEAQGA